MPQSMFLSRLELYMIMFKLIQKYKISYDGPALGVNYNGNPYTICLY